MTYAGYERRLVPRLYDAVSRVKVIAGKESSICSIHDISPGGVCLKEVGLSLTRGTRVELRFMIPISNGTTKLHLRHATVAWIKSGLTGFAIDTIPRG